MVRKIYLDNAASTKPYKEVLDLASSLASNYYANPESIHDFGKECSRLIDASRNNLLEQVIDKQDLKNYEVIFTSGATEGNNIAIQGACYAQRNFSKRVITTPIEHDSVSKVFSKLQNEGFEVLKVSIHRNGDIDWNELNEYLSKPVSFISMIHVSNMNGAILPIEDAYKLVKEKQPRCYFHSDITQAIGKIKFLYSGIDFLTFSGHKIGGLRGSGALIKRKNSRLAVIQEGGGQEKGIRSGTLNLPGDVTLSKALELSLNSLDERTKKAIELRKIIFNELKDGLDCEILSDWNCLPFVISIGLKKHKASTIEQFLSSNGIFVSTTSACDSKHDEPNYILRSMGVEPNVADNSLRISLNGEENKEDILEFINMFKNALKTIRTRR